MSRFSGPIDDNQEEAQPKSRFSGPSGGSRFSGPSKEEGSPLKSFGKSLAESVIPTAAGMAGFEAGAAGGAALGTAVAPGPGTVVGGLVGGVGGAFVASAAGQKIQQLVLENVPEPLLREVGLDPKTRAAERARDPYASFLGDLAPNLAFFRPGSVAPIVDKAGKTLISPTMQRLGLGGAGAAMETAQEAVSGEKLDPLKIATAGAFQGIAATPTGLAKKLESTVGIKRGGLEAPKLEEEAGLPKGDWNKTQVKPLDVIAVPKAAEAARAKAADIMENYETASASQRKIYDTQMKDPKVVAAMQERMKYKQEVGKAFEEGATEGRVETRDVPLEDQGMSRDQGTAIRWGEVLPIYKKPKFEWTAADRAKVRQFEREESGMRVETPEMEPKLRQEIQAYEVYPGQSRESVLEHARANGLDMEAANTHPTNERILGNSAAELEQIKKQGGYFEQASEAIRRRINNFAAALRESHNNTHSVVKDVPDPVRREAISSAIDSGNMSGLSANEVKAATNLKKWFKDIGERAQSLGIIKGLRENYISYIVDWEKSEVKDIQGRINQFIESGGGGRESTSTKSKFGKEGKYESFEELNKALQDSGLVLKTKDAAEIYQTYARSMEAAIENRKLVDNLKSITDAEGTPLMQRITEKNPIPRGWTTVNSPQLQGYAVHPDVAPALKFVFENSDPSKVMKGLNAISQTTKRVQVMGSLFHAKSLAEANLFTGFGNFAKEIVTGFKGTRDALEMFKKGGLGDDVDFLIKNGLVVEMPEDVSKGMLSLLGKGADGLISKFGPETRALEKAGATAEKYTLGLADKLTWDFMHTGFKLQTAMRLLEKAELDHPNVPREKLAREITSFTNNSFGGLNWFDVATRAQTKIGKEIAMWAYNNQNRRALQLLLFAPDWTVSTLRALKTAAGKGTGLKGLVKPQMEADFARQYQLRAALVYGTILNAVNLATVGRNIWENQDPTRIEFKDGSSMQLAKHSMEPVHWIKDPLKTLANKLGFVPKAAMTLIGGQAYPGGPKLKTGVEKAGAVVQSALPFQAQALLTAPSGEGAKRALLGTLGTPVYGGNKKKKD